MGIGDWGLGIGDWGLGPIPISKEKGEELAEEYKIPFFEASAKTGENVDEVFKALCKKISEVYDDMDRIRGGKLIKRQKNKGKCCF